MTPHHQPQERSWLRSLSATGLLTFLAIAAFFLIAEHRGARSRRSAIRVVPRVSHPAPAHARPARQRHAGHGAARIDRRKEVRDACRHSSVRPRPLVVLNSAVFIIFAFSFTHPHRA